MLFYYVLCADAFVQNLLLLSLLLCKAVYVVAYCADLLAVTSVGLMFHYNFLVACFDGLCVTPGSASAFIFRELVNIDTKIQAHPHRTSHATKHET